LSSQVFSWGFISPFPLPEGEGGFRGWARRACFCIANLHRGLFRQPLKTTGRISLANKPPEQRAGLIVQKLKKSGIRLTQQFVYSECAKADADFPLPKSVSEKGTWSRILVTSPLPPGEGHGVRAKFPSSLSQRERADFADGPAGHASASRISIVAFSDNL
jgi:hypothetical protein